MHPLDETCGKKFILCLKHNIWGSKLIANKTPKCTTRSLQVTKTAWIHSVLSIIKTLSMYIHGIAAACPTSLSIAHRCTYLLVMISVKKASFFFIISLQSSSTITASVNWSAKLETRWRRGMQATPRWKTFKLNLTK